MPDFLVGAVKAAGAGFEGWASTSQLDRQGDIVLPEDRHRTFESLPIYKRILAAIRDAWLDGKIENVDQEQAYLDELVRNEPSLHPTS